MHSKRTRTVFAIFLIVAALFLFSEPQAAAPAAPSLVARPYPGSVPEHMKEGRHAPCGDNANTWCFLTRDSVEKVRAFYAQEGIRLEPIAAKLLPGIGAGISNLEQDLRYQLDDDWPIGSLHVAPREFYRTTGADDVPSYFNALAVMTRRQRTPLKGGKARQAVIDDKVLGGFALSPVTKPFIALYGNTFLEPDLLVPLYNRRMAVLNAFYRIVDGASAVEQKREEMRGRFTAQVGGTAADLDAREEELRQELRQLLARKPEKKGQYQAVKRGIHNRETREKAQPELDKILMSDPELAAWKKRSDALAGQVQEREVKGAAQAGRQLQVEDVEAFLQTLEPDGYTTRILISGSEGRRVTRDAATLKREWRN
jgi:hypothetical protein